MAVKLYADRAKDDISTMVGKTLLRMAVTVQAAMIKTMMAQLCFCSAVT